MNRLAFTFLLSATVYLIAGMLFGIWMAASNDHQLSPVHGHLNLFGWVSMAVFGLFYFVVPTAVGRLGWVHFWVATLGVFMLVPGIAMAILEVTEGLAIAASFVMLTSVLIFAAVLLKARRSA